MHAIAELIRETAPAATAAALTAREYLSFTLGAEEYLIDLLKVQEIRSYEAPTRIANAPAYVKGVVNLRGTIVPLVDLRLKFGLDDAAYTGLTVVIVLNLGATVVGAVVDSVSDVVSLSAAELRPAPPFGSAVDADFLDGIACIDDRMLLLLDIDTLLRSDDVGLLAPLS
ncbi:MAG: chemotaxis protein CheW [Piscinibacter sp.]|nr:chemotaxis protein CheW [Piscinibacter sp.]